MTHIHKKISHHIRARRHSYLIGILGMATFFIIIGGIFTITKGINPQVSELSFTEYSILGSSAGSIIPASCESGIEHVIGVCSGFTFTADSYLVPYNTGTIVRWTFSGNANAFVDYCIAPLGPLAGQAVSYGPNNAEGTGNLTGATTYTLTCHFWSNGNFSSSFSETKSVTINVLPAPTCENGGLSGASCPTGTWSYSSSCPTACGTPASTQTETCSGGNGYCSGSASSRTCGATAECPTCANGGIPESTCNTGTLNVIPTSCTIPVNATTCTSSASWSTSYASSPALVDGNTGATLSTSANSSGLTVWVAYPQTVFNLKNGGTVLSTKTVTSSCASGSAWDGPTNKCKAFPPTVNVTLTGNRTTSGTINITCTNANSWSVTRTEGGFTQTGSGLTAAVNVTTSGNYVARCIGYDTTASSTLFYASYPLLPSEMSITAMPRTIESGSVSSLSWSITNSTTTCTLVAAPVCSGTCSQSRLNAVSVVNSKLQTENTDTNDIYNTPGILRTVMNAIKYPAPNNNPTGLKALGKKTIPLSFTTDFTLDCGTGTVFEPITPKKVRVQVTNDNEG